MAGDPLNIETWVESMLGAPEIVRDRKAIHDPVLGTHVFEPHEIALLNTPLLQRLRYISQTGFVYLTFPGARHTRFEHTIGTVVLVKRFADALNGRFKEGVIDEDAVRELRVAALLHDAGHAFFSHSSEAVYRHLGHIDGFRDANKLPGKGPGELLSYGIATSEPFRKFFQRLCELYNLQLNLDRIAKYILGVPSDPEKPYLAEIISGPFDVDKLEYIHRDAHATGLRLVVDLERFFYAITTMKVNGQRRLAIHAPEPLEQMIFSKMLLFATVYHHHKVKACDCLLKGAIQWEQRQGEHKFSAPDEFLSMTDTDFLAIPKNPLIKRLRNRDLLCRSAAISLDSIQGWTEQETPPGIYQLQQVAKEPAKLADINRQIYDALPVSLRERVLPEEIWLDIPEQPRLKELSLANIVRQDDTVGAEAIFPTQGWLNAYGVFRSKGHVFAPREVVSQVFHAAQEVFGSRFNLAFDTRTVQNMCHWN